MRSFLLNLLPRLHQFNQSIEETELFVDKPWVLIDEDEQQQTYIFRRGGELLMSLDGAVKMGTWDYIAPAQSLLIDRGSDKLLLNHFFFTNALLILARDGRPDSKFVMANRQLIPDLNIEGYLQQLSDKQAALLDVTPVPAPLQRLTLDKIYSARDTININGLPAPSGRYLTDKYYGLYVENGVVLKQFFPKPFHLKTGERIVVDCDYYVYGPARSNRIFTEHGAPLADGTYIVMGPGWIEIGSGRGRAIVKDGIIVDLPSS